MWRASACQLLLQAAAVHTRVYCTRSPLATASVWTGTVCICRHPQDMHTHSCAEANPQKPVVTRPTPARCAQWFLSITAGCLFNSLIRGPAAGLASLFGGGPA